MKIIADHTLDTSFIHGLWPGFKLTVLFGFNLFLFFINRLYIIITALVITLLLYKVAGFSSIRIWQKVRSVWVFFAVLFVFHLFFSSWQNSLIVVLRLASLLLLAGLFTLTTPSSQIMETLERYFIGLQSFGAHPAKISLALSLTLRFIPILGQIIHEVHEAQQARGSEGNIMNMTMPMIIRTLKISEDVASAIEARCYDNDA
ncbi:MAG: biotin transport system permease protein [Candidatus Tokpelaia sp. JSC085]|nr:MAG: biotin transport system permease protein [Candidatus Tokpelaia sp. JSC085]